MFDAIVVDAHRKRIALHMAEGSALNRITHMAFGDGGHNTSTMAQLQPNPASTALANELFRVPLYSVAQEDVFSVTGIAFLEDADMVGVAFSEAGLIDSLGNLVGLDTSSPKFKAPNERYEISVKINF